MKDSLTSPEHSSGSLNISVPEVAEMFRKVVQKAASQLDLSPAQLAEQAEIPKSTLSMILSDKNDRLPSLMNCLKLAYALHLDIADFFPLVNARTRYLGDLKGAFLHPKQISTPKLFEILQELQPWSSAQWCPYNIPDFCKTPEFLAIENRIPLEAAQAQIGIYNQASYLNVPGVILLRASVLRDLIERRNVFSRVSGITALKMLENIKKFAQNCHNQAKIVVADETTQSTDPILILNDRIAITYPFGSYFVSTDRGMIGYMRDRFTHYAHTLPSFEDWFSDATK